MKITNMRNALNVYEVSKIRNKINSEGEEGVWVWNVNGMIENCDYIPSK
jgi:hypothetical protein